MFRQRSPSEAISTETGTPGADTADDPVAPLSQRRSQRFRAWVEEQLSPTPREQDDDTEMSDAGVA